ncbi:hypothetical protein NEIPOLOT_00192 [Neisseria polysaccharea ATCC 43768]|nr:hypothetical protein NEIPOLOT_00192 [Neisseria polysaccharea ATCC 43768]
MTRKSASAFEGGCGFFFSRRKYRKFKGKPTMSLFFIYSVVAACAE